MVINNLHDINWFVNIRLVEQSLVVIVLGQGVLRRYFDKVVQQVLVNGFSRLCRQYSAFEVSFSDELGQRAAMVEVEVGY